MKGIRKHAAALVRTWWPELLCATLLTAVAFAGQPGDPLFAIFCAIIGGIFWAMGWRHRRTLLHTKVDKITQTMDEVREIVTATAGALSEEQEDKPPVLQIVRP